MECKFIKHGIAISYDQVVKPCCVWKVDADWQTVHHLNKTDLADWHNNLDLVEKRSELDADRWPSNCKECKVIESQGRQDSSRGNGNSAYSHYQDNDITLEIRPGSTCNFACQTCWPEASSKVAHYHSQAGLIDIKSINSIRFDDFEFLLPIADRIRDVVLLGGEPFYDKSCRAFLSWAQEHLTANLILFTNGSMIDFDFLKRYQGKITLVFSLDATNRAAEYIRFGTVWQEVLDNFKRAKELVTVRVNITGSVYNFHHLESLMELLTPDWPEVVSFGVPEELYLLENVVPVELRQRTIDSLNRSIALVKTANIESGQQHNAINALQSIVTKLESQPWDPVQHQVWCDFVTSMDRVKNIQVQDYCTVLDKILQYKVC